MPVFPNKVPDLISLGPVLEVVIFPPQPVFAQLKKENKPVPNKQVLALIDTGASGSCIDDSIAKILGLIARDIVEVGTPAGRVKQPVYDLGIGMPLANNIFPVLACGANMIGQPYQALIGRDILHHCTLIYNGWDNSYQLHL